MDAAFERRVIAWYEQASDLPPEARETFLRDTIGDDEPALTAVRRMLDADRIAGLLPTIPPDAVPSDVFAPAPERIGPYRIAGEIGRGGMGIVYRGERADGEFDQHVAIKLMRSGLFSASALAQFASERRMLARLHHPHIAQMLDGGVGEGGTSYIIMELIEGVPITDHADAHDLPLADRLELFRQACEAVDYAHRHLVVHADIKPGNVLVNDVFGVKLLDFGIARLIGQDDDDRRAPHTPGYASPARVQGLPMTPADDIYALGILMAGLTAPAGGWDADLEAIADKASARDPEKRYGTVRELLVDVDRWQRHLPVRARPPGRSRAALLLWRRRRGRIVAAGTAIVMLLATAVISTVLYLRADAARIAAERRFEETRSLSRYLIDNVTQALAPLPGGGPIRQQIALKANDTLEQLSRVPGASPELQVESAKAYTRVGEILVNSDLRQQADPKAGDAALQHAETTLRRLVAQSPDRPDLAIALAQAIMARARYLSIDGGDSKGATALLDEAARRLDVLPIPARSRVDALNTRWDVDIARGNLLDMAGNYAPLRASVPAQIKRYSALPLPHDAERALRLESAWTVLGDARYYLGDVPGSLVAYQNALAALTPEPLQHDARIAIREGYAAFNLASSLAELKRVPEALAVIRLGDDAMTRLRSFDDSANALHMQAIVTMEYASELGLAGRYDEAIARAGQSIAIREQQARIQPDSYETIRSVPVGMRPLAELYRKAGREAEACRVLAGTDAAWDAVARRKPLSDFDRTNERVLVRKLRAKCPA